MSEPTLMPTRKTGAGGLAGALTVIVLWAYKHVFGQEMDGELASAVTFLVMLGTAYLVPNKTPQDV